MQRDRLALRLHARAESVEADTDAGAVEADLADDAGFGDHGNIGLAAGLPDLEASRGPALLRRASKPSAGGKAHHYCGGSHGPEDRHV